MKTLIKILIFVMLTITFSGCIVQEDFVYRHYPTRHYVRYEIMSQQHHKHTHKMKSKPHKHKKHIQRQPQNRIHQSNRNHRR